MIEWRRYWKWLVSQEYQGQAEVDEHLPRLEQSRLPCLEDDGCFFLLLLLLHAGPDKALVVAAVCIRLAAFSFRMKMVWE